MGRSQHVFVQVECAKSWRDITTTNGTTMKCCTFCCLPNAGHFVVCQMLAILLFAKCWPFCCLLQCVTSGLDISQCRTIRGKQTCHLGKWIWAKYYFKTYTDGLVQNWSISSVLAMEIIQSCTKPVLRKAITTIYIEQGKSEGFDSCDRPTIYIEQGKSEGFDSCDRPSIQMWWKCHFCSHLTLNGPIATCFCTGVVVCAKSWRDITTTNGITMKCCTFCCLPNLAQIWSKSSIFQPVWPWNLMDDLGKR